MLSQRGLAEQYDLQRELRFQHGVPGKPSGDVPGGLADGLTGRRPKVHPFQLGETTAPTGKVISET